MHDAISSVIAYKKNGVKEGFKDCDTKVQIRIRSGLQRIHFKG